MKNSQGLVRGPETKSRLISVVAGLLVLMQVACSPRSVYELKVDARTPIDFMMWHNDTVDQLSANQWKLFNASLQEMRFRMMATYEANDSATIEEKILQRINGKKVGEIYLLGFDARLARLRGDLEQKDQLMQINTEIRTRPDDQASKDYLARLRVRQLGERQEILDEIRSVEGQRKEIENRLAMNQ